MADNYNPVQQVVPQTGSGDNLLSVRADPNAFGAQIGQATQKLGGAGEEASQQVMETALKYQNMSNVNQANTLSTKYGDIASDLDVQLHSKSGQDAADYFPEFHKQLQTKMDELADSIQSPAARNMFLQDSRNYYNRTVTSASVYVGDEVKRGVKQSFIDKGKAIDNSAINNIELPGVFDDAAMQRIQSARDEAGHDGITDPDSVNAVIQSRVGNLIYHGVIALNTKGKTIQDKTDYLDRSKALFEQYQKDVIPGTKAPLLDDNALRNIQALITNREYQLGGQLDDENVHKVSENVDNLTKIDYQEYLQNYKSTGPDDVPPSYTDFIESRIEHYGDLAREQGTGVANRKSVGDMATNTLEARLHQHVTNQNLADRMAVNTIQQYLYEGVNGKPISSEKELEHGPQEVQDAWKELKDRNPKEARALRKALNANSGGKQLTYGTDFSNQFSKILSGGYTKSAEYSSFLGPTKNAPLTNTGADLLNQHLNILNTEGPGFLQAEKAFIEKMHQEIGLDPGGNKKFEEFLQSKVPQILANHKAGKNIGDLFDEESKDYLGKDVNVYKRDLATLKTDMLKGFLNPSDLGLKPFSPNTAKTFDIKTLDTLDSNKPEDAAKAKKLVQEHMTNFKVTPEEKQQLSDYLIKRGFVVDKKKSVIPDLVPPVTQ